MYTSKLKIALTVIGISALSSCSSSQPGGFRLEQEAELNSQFEKGEILLSCDISCSGSWGYIRDELSMYFHTKRWKLLANRVIENGHNVDLNYFYLGEAALGLGFKSAAKTYFKSAIHATHDCDGSMFNNCDGINVAEQSNKRLQQLNKKPQNELKKNLKPVARQSSRTTEKKPTVAKTEKKNNSYASNRAKEYSWNELNKKLVADRMKDPESAKFKNVFFSDKFGSPATCGSVNAKNSFGAYGGFERFIGLGSTMGPFLESDVSDFNKLWRQICG